ncbi:MAG: DUF4339 domain-containing protein [Verrucomicrobiaceae bacterium]|nr:MAG: DUF4339 domain-containing protein [Verrucomicrobiaceae bacterium]
MQWYYSKNGTQLGPVEEAELRSKITSGEITSADLVWREGMTDWLPSSRVAELASVAAAAPLVAAPGTPVPPSEGTATSPYQPPVNSGYSVAPPAPSSGKATASMVLGIVGLVFGLCGCYGIMISLPCCILAIVFGSQVKKEVLHNPALAADEGKAKAGVIMGWIGIAITVVFTVGLMVLGLASGAMSELNR